MGHSEDPNAGDAVQPPNRVAAERAERLRQAIKLAGGNNRASERSGVPLSTLGHYLRGRDPQSEVLAAIADACSVSIEWLATGRGSMAASWLAINATSLPGPGDDPRYLKQNPEFPAHNKPVGPIVPLSQPGAAAPPQAPLRAPIGGPIDPRLLAQAIDIIDQVLATSGRSWNKVERAQRIVRCYEQLTTPLEDLPPLPQLPTQPMDE